MHFLGKSSKINYYFSLGLLGILGPDSLKVINIFNICLNNVVLGVVKFYENYEIVIKLLSNCSTKAKTNRLITMKPRINVQE